MTRTIDTDPVGFNVSWQLMKDDIPLFKFGPSTG